MCPVLIPTHTHLCPVYVVRHLPWPQPATPPPAGTPPSPPPPPPHYLQEQADVFIQVTAHKVVMSSAWQEPALLENLPQRPVALKVRLTASLWPARTLGDTCPAELAPRRSASGRVTATY